MLQMNKQELKRRACLYFIFRTIQSSMHAQNLYYMWSICFRGRQLFCFIFVVITSHPKLTFVMNVSRKNGNLCKKPASGIPFDKNI